MRKHSKHRTLSLTYTGQVAREINSSVNKNCLQLGCLPTQNKMSLTSNRQLSPPRFTTIYPVCSMENGPLQVIQAKRKKKQDSWISRTALKSVCLYWCSTTEKRGKTSAHHYEPQNLRSCQQYLQIRQRLRSWHNFHSPVTASNSSGTKEFCHVQNKPVVHRVFVDTITRNRQIFLRQCKIFHEWAKSSNTVSILLVF